VRVMMNRGNQVVHVASKGGDFLLEARTLVNGFLKMDREAEIINWTERAPERKEPVGRTVILH
jgi:hypothetical protein